MRVRTLSTDGDMTFGRGAEDFYRDSPAGVGQCIATRLKLILGEWFLDVTQGTDWGGKVIGRRGAKSYDAEIKRVILATSGVDGIASYASDLSTDRQLTIRAQVLTIYSASEVVTVTETLALRLPA